MRKEEPVERNGRDASRNVKRMFMWSRNEPVQGVEKVEPLRDNDGIKPIQVHDTVLVVI